MTDHKKGAFTLIEVLVAVAIFSLGVVGLLTVVATGQRNFVEAKLLSKAMFLAEQKMNDVYWVGYQIMDEDDENYILDEEDDENPIEIISKEGEFYNESYDSYEMEEKQKWLKDYYWQVIIQESNDLAGMQMVTVKVFNKNFSGENDYTDVEYGKIAQLITYLSATRASQEKKKDDK